MPLLYNSILVVCLLVPFFSQSLALVYFENVERHGSKRIHYERAEIQIPLELPSQTTYHSGLLAITSESVPATSFSSQDPFNVFVPTSSNSTFSILPEGSLSQNCVGSSASDSRCPSRMLVMGYYPDWVGSTFPPSSIDLGRLDWIDFAFAVPTANYNLTWDDPSGPILLEQLVNAAHLVGVKVKLSIGGWTGSKHFSSAVATSESRAVFAGNILSTYLKYQVDGIEIDWEYPGQAGAPGNKFNPDDTSNFLLFLKTLRGILPPGARITAAVEPTPFLDNNGHPLEDATEFSKVLDWVLIMNYDLWGSSSHPGPNAPLYDACGNSTQPDASALGAYNSWTKANFPASQLVLGLPSYGYLSSSSENRLRTRSKSKSKSDSTTKQKKSLKVVNDDGDSEGQVQFRELVKQGALLYSNETGRYEASSGFEGLWDSCSSTPYLRSPSSHQLITYDSPLSLNMKAEFAKKVGMLGINLFDIHGDTEDWILLDSIRYAMDLD